MFNNIFLNNYATNEDQLTYNFLCTLELLEKSAQRDLLSFLISKIPAISSETLTQNPIVDIKPVFFFSQKPSNPDGCIIVRKSDNTEISLYIEVKTNKRSLEKNQLLRHITGFCSEENSYLLAITPRFSDSLMTEELKTNKFGFITWQEIASHIKTKTLSKMHRNHIAEHFIQYAENSGEFMTPELDSEDIKIYSQYNTRHPELRLRTLLEEIAASFDFSPFFNVIKKPTVVDAWGRITIDIHIGPNEERWMGFGVYYDTKDHGIPFYQNEPELAFFIDTSPKYRGDLLKIPMFINAIKELESDEFVQNLTTTVTTNQYRLAWWKQPLSQYQAIYQTINCKTLTATLTSLLKKLHEKENFSKIFFAKNNI
jgi:hypothetical protein